MWTSCSVGLSPRRYARGQRLRRVLEAQRRLQRRSAKSRTVGEVTMKKKEKTLRLEWQRQTLCNVNDELVTSRLNRLTAEGWTLFQACEDGDYTTLYLNRLTNAA